MRSFVRSISEAFKWISGILVGLTVILNFVAVFSRYLFSKPIMWCEEVSLLMFVTALSFSIIPMTYNKRAVKLDFFTDMMPPKMQFVCSIVVEFICCIALGTTTVFGLDLIKRSKYRFTPVLDISYKVIYAVTVIGMAISALVFVYHIINDIIEHKNASEEVPK